jgi:ubiquinone/menaquinone biosynthesis C-methylase UbiE
LAASDIADEIDKDGLRENLSKYTRKAFHILPEIKSPRILDIGCGSGVPTMVLAGLTDGEIVGLDTDGPSLRRLERKIEEAGVSDRVSTVERSMVEMDFSDGSFDIIWAEGSIFAVGFKRGLTEWRRFLRTDGFLVVHDSAEDITRKLEQVRDCGYELLGHFRLDEETWWSEYYGPLEGRVGELRRKYEDNPDALKVVGEEEREIGMVKRDPGLMRSVFLVMQKKS